MAWCDPRATLRGQLDEGKHLCMNYEYFEEAFEQGNMMSCCENKGPGSCLLGVLVAAARR